MIVTANDLLSALGVTSATSAQTARATLAVTIGHAAIRKYIGYDPEQSVGPAEFYPRADSLIQATDIGVWDKSGMKAVLIGESRAFEYLQLQRLPVRSISEIRVDYAARFGQQAGDFGEGTAWTEGDDYAIEWDAANYCRSGCVISMIGWPATLGTVKVTYRAGYSSSEFTGPAASSSTADDGTITVAGVDASPLRSAAMLECIRAYHTLHSFAQGSSSGVMVPGPKQSESLGSYSYSLASGASAAMLASMVAEISPQAAGLCDPFKHYGVLVG